MKEQHEILVNLEEKCKKYQTLIYEHKTGVERGKERNRTEEDVMELKEQLEEAESKCEEERRKYNQLIANHENVIKNLNYELNALTLLLKDKDQMTKMNNLRINELNRLIKAHGKPKNRVIKTERKAESNANIIAVNLDKFKRVILTEESFQSETLKEATSHQIIEKEGSPILTLELKKNFNDAMMQTLTTSDVEDTANKYVIK